MRIPRSPHRWDVSPSRAVQIQRDLAPRIRQVPLPRPPRLIAGADMALPPDGEHCIAGVVVWDSRSGTAIEQQSARCRVTFPYVPGLLSFREAPAILAAIRKLKNEPEVFMLDGQGRAHPRGLGLASHVGLILDRPALGCAKSLLCGRYENPPKARGSRSPLTLGAETIGAVVRTREGVKPVFVSVGHRLTLDEAVSCVLGCCRTYRLCEPIRLAHHFVTRLRLR